MAASSPTAAGAELVSADPGELGELVGEQHVDVGIRLPRSVTYSGVSYVVVVSPEGFRFALRGPAAAVAAEWRSLALDCNAHAARLERVAERPSP